MTKRNQIDPDRITALQPRGKQGHQFVFYGDCCSGVPGRVTESNFAAVNSVIQRLSPFPEFLAFLGDHVFGLTQDASELRRQWRHWLDHEMAWLARRKDTPVYHVTSNHSTYDAASEEVWREVLPDLPRNGPPGQEGLSYFVRRGGLLLAVANTSYSALGGYGHVESQWLDETLGSNADAAWKIVLGHHPLWPVNGYDEYPLWRVVPGQAMPFWDVLVRHGVLAYLCSHIIAFDVQAHRGVLQVATGGAGTLYGPGGFMPGPIEYLHTVQAALDARGLRYQVLDREGRVRERLDWPLALPPSGAWEVIPAIDGSFRRTVPAGTDPVFGSLGIQLWRFTGRAGKKAGGSDQVLLAGSEGLGMPDTVRVVLAGARRQLRLHLRAYSGEPGSWKGFEIGPSDCFDFQLAVHCGMGPGGILARAHENVPWSSLSSSCAWGVERVRWPSWWRLCSRPLSLRWGSAPSAEA
ncbi:MAG: metallophosphoesterase [Planctomycetes bacterium]|nr:metallophosphoesterase [Planctomycetota bacterium]